MQEVFTELLINLVFTGNTFIVFDQVDFRVFCNLFRQKSFDSFPNILLSVTTKYSIISYNQIFGYQLQPNIRLSVTTKYSIISYNQILYYQLQPNIRLSVITKYSIINYNQIFYYQLQPNIRLSVTTKYSIIS